MINLRLGDCLDILPTLEAGSVDVVITDPPYGMGFWNICDDWFSLASAVLEQDGSLYVFCGIGEKSDSLSRILPLVKKHFIFKNLITWKKQRGYGTQRNRMYTREEIIFAVKSRDYYYCPQYTDEPRSQFKTGKMGKMAQKNKPRSKFKRASNVWADVKEISPGVGNSPEWTGKHPTQKPTRLMERIIKASARPGSIILDPFMGSGTTGVACVKTGRSFIGIEIDPDYFAIAEQRIAEAQLQPRLEAL